MDGHAAAHEDVRPHRRRRKHLEGGDIASALGRDGQPALACPRGRPWGELMRRTTRALALTEAGAAFLVRSRTILASVNDARDVVRPGRGVAGVVSVSLPVSFGLAQIALLFPALIAAHPRLKLDLRFEDRIVDLLGDGVDLAVRAGMLLPVAHL